MSGPLRVALLGTGLIGGSIGMALRARADVEVVAAYDAVPGRAERAVAVGACLLAAPTVADAVADVDVVFVAVPVSSVADLVLEAARHASPGTVVTDVGSVKGPIVSAVGPTLPEGVEFVGGHPMAGSEQGGIEAASPDLFRNAVWVVTPTPETDPDAVLLVHRLVSSMGASALTVDPVVHDESVSVISHLPHIAASALMNMAADRAEQAPPVFRMAAGGFRDVTRIAAGSPDVWVDILAENREAISDALLAYVAELERFCEDLTDRGRLGDHLARAGAARRSLPSQAFPEDLWAVVVAVTDHPGVFAEVTTAVGASGVNIVDVTLRHSPEGGAGILTLGVAGQDAADIAVQVLRDRGYAAHSEPTEAVGILAIDGPAGSGKSTVSRLAAEHLGMTRLDTGALYRAVTAAVLRDGIDPGDARACGEAAGRARIRLGADGTVTLDGEDVTERIRSGDVTAAVSQVSSHPAVRRGLVDHQRAVAAGGGWVVEGRDIGTVVFPDARLKVFLTASPAERARRRAAETGETNLAEVQSDIARRDTVDSTRDDSPLRQADDAVLLDTTGLTIEAVVEQVVGLWLRGRGAGVDEGGGMVERSGEEGGE